MDYIFVATETQVGSKIIKGPITGKEWLVTPKGNWIADEFERTDRWLLMDIPRYCFKTRTMINTKICLISPSWDQMELMPTD